MQARGSFGHRLIPMLRPDAMSDRGGGADCKPINGLVGALSVLCPGPDSNRAAGLHPERGATHKMRRLELPRVRLLPV
ncbi:hypothetical protein LMG29542_08316 [Paraburkholderia humisilvae]|uniref:Uncharacterized protein n=1 Tax=Paraburkholderia humisilvae TaxID=627669 RepID=A0A6J5F8W1_9BURK|nr:hypothetical protein LMG29542_08316 [Paraburkholderia humisilvae]